MQAMIEAALLSYSHVMNHPIPEQVDPRRQSERQRLLSPFSKQLYDSRALAAKAQALEKREEIYTGG